jgi:predicted TPR repeat methyltransferase
MRRILLLRGLQMQPAGSILPTVQTVPTPPPATAPEFHPDRAQLMELVPPDLAPLLASRRWTEAWGLTVPRIAGDAGDARAWHAHGLAGLGLRRFAEGGAALDRAVWLGAEEPGPMPGSAYAKLAAAYALAAEGQGQTAIRRLAFQRANQVPASSGLLAAMAVRAPSQVRLCRTAEELLSMALTLGHDDIAAHCAAGWLAISPDNATARFMLSATAGTAVPVAAPADYLREHFDGFAPGFETTLVERLGYNTPQVMCDALLPWMRQQQGALRILDAGCGTGLSGPVFRPFAAHLAGVDIAPGMLELAAAKGCYDALDAAELTEFLRAAAKGPAFDLIVATDVVMYFGEVASLLEGACAVLRPGGRFGFTVEAHDQPGHRLYPTGRYKHERSFVEQQLARAGLVSRVVEPTVIRQEGGEPVTGWLFLAERPSAP